MSAPRRSYYQSNFISNRWRSGLAEMVRGLLPEGWESARILDVGVGDGFTIRLVKPLGTVEGIDMDPEEVKLAVERGVLATVGSVYELKFPNASFDIVTCFEVIEHLERPKDALVEILRVLKPGGFIVMTTPVPNLRWSMIWWFWTKIGPGRRWNKIPHISEMHIGDETSEGTLASLLSSLGVKVVKTAKGNYGMVAGLLAAKS